MKKTILFFSVAIVTIGWTAPALTQTTPTNNDSLPVMATLNLTEISASPEVSVSLSSNTAVEDNTVKIPSTWGLFWKSTKEKMSLSLTFNSIKKAEKALAYAEERARLAEAFGKAASDNPLAQARAKAMTDRAEALMNIALERKAKIEAVSPEAFAKMETMRTNLNNRISETKTFLTEKKDLLERAQQGDEAAKAELRTLREEKKEMRQDIREDVKAINTELREQIKIHNTEAKQEVKNIRDTQKEMKQEVKKVREQKRETTQEAREVKKETKQEIRKDVKKEVAKPEEIIPIPAEPMPERRIIRLEAK